MTFPTKALVIKSRLQWGDGCEHVHLSTVATCHKIISNKFLSHLWWNSSGEHKRKNYGDPTRQILSSCFLLSYISMSVLGRAKWGHFFESHRFSQRRKSMRISKTHHGRRAIHDGPNQHSCGKTLGIWVKRRLVGWWFQPTRLKNMSQIGSFSQPRFGVKIKQNIWNHHS